MSIPKPPFHSVTEELLYEIFLKFSDNDEVMQLIKERGIITVNDTDQLQQLGSNDTLLVLVKDIALFSFESSGVADGNEIFNAAGGGVWKALKQNPVLPNPIRDATFQNDSLPVLGLYQDIRVETNDWQDQDHPFSPKPLLMNIKGNAISAAIINEPNSGISFFAIQSGTSNAGIQIDDQQNFVADFYTPTSWGANYTGDIIPSGIISSMFYNVNDGLLYYVANLSALYTFDPSAFVNTKRTITGASGLRFLGYDAVNNRIAAAGSNCLVSYSITTSTYKVYTKVSNNYTGDRLPSSAISDMAVVNEVVWFARGTTISPADNGLIKFNLLTEVCTRYTNANGLVDSKVGGVVANGDYLYVRYAGVTTTPISRFNALDNTIINYGNSTSNYSGDKIPVEAVNLFKFDFENQILICNTSSKIWIAKVGGFSALTVSAHTNVLGYSLTNFNLNSLSLRRIVLDGFDNRLLFYFTAASSSSGPGIQLFKFYEDTHPVKVVYDKLGLNLTLLDRKVLGKNSVAVKSLFDDFKASIDLSVSQLDQEKDNTIIEISDGQLLQPNNRSIYYTYVYSEADDIVVELQIVNTSINRITFTQRGVGKITIIDGGGAGGNVVGGKLTTTGQWDSIEIIRTSAGTPGQWEFIGK